MNEFNKVENNSCGILRDSEYSYVLSNKKYKSLLYLKDFKYSQIFLCILKYS